MNVTINRAEMLSAIKRASAIAPADSPLDVLRGVLLEADAAAGKLTVTSTNLEAALEEKLPCTVQEDGALVFGAKMLAEMLSRLPQDTVQLCRAENQGRMTLRSGDACYEVDVWERGAFPKPDLPFPEDTVKLSGIPAMAQHTVFATAQDNSKPLLKCVNLMFTNTGLRAAGSNGNCIVTARGDNQSTGDVSLLIPAASLGKLSNMCQDKDEFRVGTTGKSIVFFRENFLLSARLMEGGYIDTDQLVGSIRNAFTVLTDIHDMRAALSSVLSIGTGNRVKLSFQDQRLVFQCAGDCVSASAPIEVIALTGAPAGDYWFNAKQLVTCLKFWEKRQNKWHAGDRAGRNADACHAGCLLSAKCHAAGSTEENSKSRAAGCCESGVRRDAFGRDSDDLPLLRRRSPSCSRSKGVWPRGGKKTGLGTREILSMSELQCPCGLS